MSIKISPDAREESIASLKRYFEEDLDQEIGDLKAGLLLDYVLKEIGPVIYNRAISDAKAFIQEKAVDLEGVCFEDEFGYWT